MSIKVGINGFGRMGRLALRESWGCADFEIVHINEMAGDVQSAAHLLRFDSVHGQWDKEVSVKEDWLFIEGQRISYSQNKAINDTQWQLAEVDLVLDCTGAFKSPEALKPYFDQGVAKVVVSAPIKGFPRDQVLNVVVGVNDHEYVGQDIVTAAASDPLSSSSELSSFLRNSIKFSHDSRSFLSAFLSYRPLSLSSLIFLSAQSMRNFSWSTFYCTSLCRKVSIYLPSSLLCTRMK